MYSQTSQMIECYRLDFPQVAAPWESINVTQGDINRCDGFDDYDAYIAGSLSTPRLPDNSDYMEGWHKNERDRASYLDWKEFCK